MPVVLKVANGHFAGRSRSLKPGQTLKVGSGEWAQFTIPYDAQMSDPHFALKYDASGCHVQDLQSDRGTFLNGKPVSEAAVSDGDEIRAGQTTFTVEVDSGPQTSTPAPSSPTSAQTDDATASKDGASEASSHPPISAGEASGDGASPELPLSLGHAFDGARPYDWSLGDEDPLVRRAALWAPAWSRQPWLLDYCREVSTQPSLENWDALHLLAILGQPSELDRILTVGRAVELGPSRFTVLGTFGHPAVVEEILTGLENKDPSVAVAAGRAFSKMTSADIDSENTASFAEEESGAEPAEQGFPEGSPLPDPTLANDHWNQVRSQFAQGTRWCRGFDLSREVTVEIVDRLDLESRWETCLRGKYRGIWNVGPIDLERFPTVLLSARALPEV